MTKSELKAVAKKLLRDTELAELVQTNSTGVRNIQAINAYIEDIADELGLANSYDLAWALVNNYKAKPAPDPVKQKRLMALLK